MKKILLSLVLTVSLLGAQASFGIHSGCRGRTFAYNAMDVLENGGSINFILSGATVFNLTGKWEGGAISSFELDRSRCQFSDDKLLFSCTNISEATITRSLMKLNSFSTQDQEEIKHIVVKDLTLEVRYVESVDFRSSFELVTRYKVEDSDDYTSNRVLFRGDRTSGCTERG